MAKTDSKTVSKQTKTNQKDQNVPKRAKAIQKPKTVKQSTKKTNPTPTAFKGQKLHRTPVARKFFTVSDDVQLLEALKNSPTEPLSQIAQSMSVTLGRSVESVRDRLKRYLTKLSPADKKEILSQPKKAHDWFVYFVPNKNDTTKKIEKISVHEPALKNRVLVRKPRVSKKIFPTGKVKKVTPPDERLKWVVDKLQNKDPYFKLEFSVQLLADILNHLIKSEKVALPKIEKLINEVHSDKNLKEILDSLLSSK